MVNDRQSGARTRRIGSRAGLPLLAAALAVPFAACSTDDILEVDYPDIVLPGNLQGEEGLATLYAGALGDFAVAFSGDVDEGTEGQILASGLLADEWVSSGTFPTRIEVDARQMDERNLSLTDLFRNLQIARRAAEAAVDAFGEVSEDPDADPRVSELFSLAGYTYVFAGENYCSGVPFSTDENGALEYGAPLDTESIWDVAIARFDTALAHALSVGDPDLEYLARVGMARVLLDRGDHDAAAAVVAPVPTLFAYFVEHSDNTFRQQNAVYVLNALDERWSVANVEGDNGLPFIDALDPRVPVEATGFPGFDGATPQYNLLKFPGRSAPTILADGVEARLIEAEALLRSDDFVPEGLAILNDLRQRAGEILMLVRPQDNIQDTDFAMPPLADPGTLAGREDLLFEERAFWLFASSHRLSDLRRLVRQYGRDPADVFPTGVHEKTGLYGSDVNFPVPFAERNNPQFTGCIDRAA